ncbi:MarR family transcriptional regulator [Pseudoalteromonas luteoviolacea]|uniref:MarR family winged helix-turn-helix transcriptional regulator n=1 Tax=Pseudoalteromonas luteoviolacea TaxID=43657 RepID=UPI001B36201E|nr:MarR family transcriptional regulator [Pseudoalteromonas luteoviolacea]MBQ4810525.1 MarR family transcriptional regulator [Pseudoalteromonas luteoviolacea]
MSSDNPYKNSLNNRLKAFELSESEQNQLALDSHIPFQVAVVSNLLSISRDPIIKNLTDLDTRELRILVNIGSYGPIAASDIAYQSRLDPYSITRAIAALAKKELVEYQEGVSRSKPVLLTANGQEIYKKVIEHLKTREEKLLEPFSQEERKLLGELLQKLELNAEALLATEVADCQKQGLGVTRDHKEIERWFKRTNK